MVTLVISDLVGASGILQMPSQACLCFRMPVLHQLGGSFGASRGVYFAL